MLQKCFWKLKICLYDEWNVSERQILKASFNKRENSYRYCKKNYLGQAVFVVYFFERVVFTLIHMTLKNVVLRTWFFNVVFVDIHTSIEFAFIKPYFWSCYNQFLNNYGIWNADFWNQSLNLIHKSPHAKQVF